MAKGFRTFLVGEEQFDVHATELDGFLADVKTANTQATEVIRYKHTAEDGGNSFFHVPLDQTNDFLSDVEAQGSTVSEDISLRLDLPSEAPSTQDTPEIPQAVRSVFGLAEMRDAAQQAGDVAEGAVGRLKQAGASIEQAAEDLVAKTKLFFRPDLKLADFTEEELRQGVIIGQSGLNQFLQPAKTVLWNAATLPKRFLSGLPPLAAAVEALTFGIVDVEPDRSFDELSRVEKALTHTGGLMGDLAIIFSGFGIINALKAPRYATLIGKVGQKSPLLARFADAGIKGSIVFNAKDQLTLPFAADIQERADTAKMSTFVAFAFAGIPVMKEIPKFGTAIEIAAIGAFGAGLTEGDAIDKTLAAATFVFLHKLGGGETVVASKGIVRDNFIKQGYSRAEAEAMAESITQGAIRSEQIQAREAAAEARLIDLKTRARAGDIEARRELINERLGSVKAEVIARGEISDRPVRPEQALVELTPEQKAQVTRVEQASATIVDQIRQGEAREAIRGESNEAIATRAGANLKEQGVRPKEEIATEMDELDAQFEQATTEGNIQELARVEGRMVEVATEFAAAVRVEPPREEIEDAKPHRVGTGEEAIGAEVGAVAEPPTEPQVQVKEAGRPAVVEREPVKVEPEVPAEVGVEERARPSEVEAPPAEPVAVPEVKVEPEAPAIPARPTELELETATAPQVAKARNIPVPRAQQEINQAQMFTGTFDAPKGDIKAEIPRPAAPGKQFERGGLPARPKESPQTVDDFESPSSVIQLPQMVQIARELLGGKLPKVVKNIRAMQGRALGVFIGNPLNPEIKIRADLFQRISNDRAAELSAEATLEAKETGGNTEEIEKRLITEELSAVEGLGPVQAMKTLAHEIGHLVDWLPQKDLSRGNVLGRIASLKRFMATTLAETPEQAEQFLSKKDRQKIRNTAQKQARSEGLKDDALKKRTTELNKELLDQEIKERGLVTLAEVRDEMIAVSKWWKPFDETIKDAYTKYRLKPEELYADTFSVLINNPAALAARAPKFTNAFFNFLKRKPAVNRIWEQIQNDINAGRTEANMVKELRDSFAENDAKVREKLGVRDYVFADFINGFKQGFIDRHSVLLDQVKEVIRSVDVPVEKNPEFAIENMLYAGAEWELYANGINFEVIPVLKEGGVDWSTFNEFVFHKRVIEERSELANTAGWTKEISLDRLASMQVEYGDRGMLALEEAQKQLFANRQPLIKLLEDSGTLPENLMAKIKDNEFYVTFNVVKEIDSALGGNVGPRIHRQIGTFEGVQSPVDATIAKDLALSSAAHRNIAKSTYIEFMQEFAPQGIDPAKTKFDKNLGFPVPQEPTDPRKALMVIMQEGKPKGFIVDQGVADGFNWEPPIQIRLANRVLSALTQPFREVYVQANYGFWLFNLVRDYKRAVRGLKGASMTKFIKDYIAGIKPAFRSVYGIKDETINDMLRGRMLISLADPRGIRGEDRQLEFFLAKAAKSPKTWQQQILRPWEPFLAGLQWYTNVGQAFERVPKVAAFNYLKREFPGLTETEIAHTIRTQAGSPAFLRRGLFYGTINNLFPFSNAMKEGWRSELDLAKEGPGEWAYKHAKYTVLPKLITWAMRAGIVSLAIPVMRIGDEDEDEGGGPKPKFKSLTPQQLYGPISPYDLMNYNVIPFGVTPQGKTVYFRIPQDENSRMIGGIVWTALTTDEGFQRELLSYLGGDVPGISPIIKLSIAAGQFYGGQNPYDWFKGGGIIKDNTIWKAQNEETNKEFRNWAFNEMGAGIIYRFKSDRPDEIKTDLEKFLDLPIIGNSVGRFLKVSDQGIRAEITEVRKQVGKEQARDSLVARSLTRKILGEQGGIGTLTDNEMRVLAEKSDFINDSIKTSMAKQMGGVFMQQFLTARTTKEKVAVLVKIQEIQNRGKGATVLLPELTSSDFQKKTDPARGVPRVTIIPPKVEGPQLPPLRIEGEEE